MKIRYVVRVNVSGNFAIGDTKGASLFYRILENDSVPNHSNLLGVQHDLWVKEMKILNRLRKWGGL